MQEFSDHMYYMRDVFPRSILEENAKEDIQCTREEPGHKIMKDKLMPLFVYESDNPKVINKNNVINVICLLYEELLARSEY